MSGSRARCHSPPHRPPLLGLQAAPEAETLALHSHQGAAWPPPMASLGLHFSISPGLLASEGTAATRIPVRVQACGPRCLGPGQPHLLGPCSPAESEQASRGWAPACSEGVGLGNALPSWKAGPVAPDLVLDTRAWPGPSTTQAIRGWSPAPRAVGSGREQLPRAPGSDHSSAFKLATAPAAASPQEDTEAPLHPGALGGQSHFTSPGGSQVPGPAWLPSSGGSHPAALALTGHWPSGGGPQESRVTARSPCLAAPTFSCWPPAGSPPGRGTRAQREASPGHPPWAFPGAHTAGRAHRKPGSHPRLESGWR